MSNQEVLALLRKIDNGYKPTEEEKAELSNIEKITWKNIENIPESMNFLINIKELDVSGDFFHTSSIVVIPDSIGDLMSLKSLNLSFSQVSSLPESIGNLSSLQNLDLSSTRISSLPETIGNLTSLQSLSLSLTKISSLPESIGNLTSLQSLSLSLTKISSLSESIGNLPSLQILDLSYTQIRSLPESIGNLPSLQSLNLSNTKISFLPKSIWNLTSLQGLSLRYTQIRFLPESIGKLTSLQSLNLSATQISSLPENIGNLTSLQNLDLSSTKISSLPESIGNLTRLQSLDLRSTKVSFLPESIGKLTSLQSLFLSHMKIGSLPESMWNLSSLQNFDLNNTQIRSLPESIGKLTSLQSLDLRGTQINSLPESMWNLSSLQSLDLRGTQINSLPESIGNLTRLQGLSLSNMKIGSLPESIGNLTSLQSLYLKNTQIRSLPESIGKLTSLQSLNLSATQISSLPENIGNLTSLQNLDLSSTKISSLPESIGNLTRLQSLDLNDTQIRSLPESIGNLTSLQSLDLSDTQIRSLPESIGNLTSLQSLYLSNTQIRSLPESIGKLTSLQRLVLISIPIGELSNRIGTLPELKELILEYITLAELPEELLSLNLDYKNVEYNYWERKPGIYTHGLRLQKQPVSLFYQPRELIIDYYKQQKIDINETKVIFLGSEGVGKTHTIKRILNDNHKISETLKETPGISIAFKDFDIGKFSYRINFWDFGGQEIMHAMHRCFLTDRTGYVVVVSTRFGDVNKQARYWLKNIESFTKGAPVVIYVNKWSDGTYYSIDEYSLHRDYPNIIDVKQCSAKDGDDVEFEEVVKAIQKMALANDSIAMSFPSSWENVRQEIIKLGTPGSRKYYISQREFRVKCQSNGIDNSDIQAWLLEWFNDLGECFSYKFDEEDPTPDMDLKVLNPEWLTNAIYIIIREAGDLAVNGFIAHEGIRNKLDHSDRGTLKDVSYTEAECNYVLEVMRKFRLSYKVPGRPEEFIPALLREAMPSDIEQDGYVKVISYEMKYKYLPENVIHNLMIMMYPYLDYHRCWRKGMVIDVRQILNIGLYAVLDMSRDDDILRIKVYSYANNAPWQLLQEIRSDLLDINSRLNLEADDYILIESGSSIEEVSVERLLRLKKRGKTYYEGYDEDFEINELLGDTFGEEQILKIEKKEHTKKYGFDDSSMSGNERGEYGLSEMKADLIQPADKRLFSQTRSGCLTCEQLCELLLSACAQIQSNPIYWNEKEDARSTQVRTILRNNNVFVSDQTLYGHAKDSTNSGEVDLMVMKNAKDPLTIVEAMNINSVDKSYIQAHLNKLLDDYNPNGLHELFLVGYVQKAKTYFQSFWKRYVEYITRTDAGDFLYKSMNECETNNHYIKHAVVEYSCDGAMFTVHHICMRAGD